MSLLKGLKINLVSINVGNLERMISFYQEILGFSVISKGEDFAQLGVGNNALLELIEIKNAPLGHSYNGLYHVAYLLSSKTALADFLIHLANHNIRIGASNHGFSNALYLNDPERNGIEVYVDLPKLEWPYEEDGSLSIVSEKLDLYQLAFFSKNNQFTGLPKDTIIGHIHLVAKDLTSHRKFYLDKLQMDLQIDTPNAVFASVDGYHHHIAANNWSNPIGVRPDKFLGLNYYSLTIDNYQQVKQILQDEESFTNYETSFKITDPNGINIIFKQ